MKLAGWGSSCRVVVAVSVLTSLGLAGQRSLNAACPSFVTLPYFTTGPHSPSYAGTVQVAADFDGDGNLDLAGPTCVFLGNGDGSFAAPLPFTTGAEPSAVAVGDFDEDGISDLAVVNTTVLAPFVSILVGRGDGTFRPAVHELIPAASFAATTPNAIAVGDFDGDDNTDLAVTLGMDPTVAVMLGRGDATFAPAAKVPLGTNYFETRNVAVAAGDVDADGTFDLVVASSGPFPQNITVLLGNGDGTFRSPLKFAAGALPTFVALDHFDSDGNIDIAVANDFSTDVSILLGHGDGTFSAPTSYLTQYRPFALVPADLNGDGKADLAAANWRGGVSVLYGNGDGTFSPAVEYALESGALTIVSGDFNHDGKIDLAATSLRFAADTTRYLTVLLSDSSCNALPSLTPAPATVTAGSTGATATIARVDDPDGAAGSLAVALTSVPSGLGITALKNVNGMITATLSASCSMAPGRRTVGLEVRDTAGGKSRAIMTIDVVATNSMILGHYGNASTALGGSASVYPSMPPMSDLVSTIAVRGAQGFNGAASIDPITGVVTVTNAGPPGPQTISIAVTDNCGGTTTRSFVLNVEPAAVPLGAPWMLIALAAALASVAVMRTR